MASRNLLLVILLVASLDRLALVAADDAAFVLPPESTALKPGPGAELVSGKCLTCHSADYVSTQPRLAAPAWKGIVVKMQQKFGAPITANEVDPLVDYLAANYGAPPQ